MSNLCIIPARGGSKRIPRKNIREFYGKPIIGYSIEAAKESELFDEIMVSTDDEEIARIAKEHGANVPFMRSEKSADDFATTSDVISEVINNYKSGYGRDFDMVCCIYPTAPLISVDHLAEGYNLLAEGNRDSVFPAVNFSYPVQRAIKIDDSNKAAFVWPENALTRSQDLESYLHDAGQFYWIRVDSFLETQKLISNNSSCVVLDALEVQDIDNLTDWRLAELKYEALQINRR